MSKLRHWRCVPGSSIKSGENQGLNLCASYPVYTESSAGCRQSGAPTTATKPPQESPTHHSPVHEFTITSSSSLQSVIRIWKSKPLTSKILKWQVLYEQMMGLTPFRIHQRQTQPGLQPSFLQVFHLISTLVMWSSAGWLQICLQTVTNCSALFFLQS